MHHALWGSWGWIQILRALAGGNAPAANLRFWLTNHKTGQRTLVFVQFKYEAGATRLNTIMSDYEAVEGATDR